MSLLDHFRHPHHISLVDTHSLRAKLQHSGDIYYNIDGLPSHKGVLAPKFDVFELTSATPATTEPEAKASLEHVTGWLIEGEVPGLKTEDIKIEWLEEVTIFIRGTLSTSSVSQVEGTPKPLHKERQEGTFERSVTLPTKADTKGVKVEVKEGVVYVTVPKKIDAE